MTYPIYSPLFTDIQREQLKLQVENMKLESDMLDWLDDATYAMRSDPIQLNNGTTIPLASLNTPDRGKIFSTIADTYVPSLHEAILTHHAKDLEHKHFKIVPEGCENAIVHASFENIEEHLRNLSQVKRSLKHSDKVMFVQGWPELGMINPEAEQLGRYRKDGSFFSLFVSNLFGFKDSSLRGPHLRMNGSTGLIDGRKENEDTFDLGWYTRTLHKLYGPSAWNADNFLRIMCLDKGTGEMLGVAVFEELYSEQGRELYWVNTYLYREDPRIRDWTIGNQILLQGLQYCYDNGIKIFNMGLGHFGYKRDVWKAELIWRRGLELSI